MTNAEIVTAVVAGKRVLLLLHPDAFSDLVDLRRRLINQGVGVNITPSRRHCGARYGETGRLDILRYKEYRYIPELIRGSEFDHIINRAMRLDPKQVEDLGHHLVPRVALS